jgi:small subunit ribosomal protein S17
MEKEKTIKIKRLQGFVTKLSSINTIKVKVEIKAMHPKYQKVIRSHKEYLAHCIDKDIKVGDIVIIEEGKPVSKTKCFYLVKKI